MFTAITTILYWAAYSAVAGVILMFFGYLNWAYLAEGWREYRMGALLRLMRIRVKSWIRVTERAERIEGEMLPSAEGVLR